MMAALIVAAGMMLHSQPDKKAAALPHLSDVMARSNAERYVLKRVHQGLEADLTKLGERHLSAAFVTTLVFKTAASAVPSKLIAINGAIIRGPLTAPTGSSPVANNILFSNCIFEEPLELGNARFDQSLYFVDTVFRQGIRLDLAQIKRDLVFVGGSIRAEIPRFDAALDLWLPALSLNSVQVDGEIQLRRVHVKDVWGENAKAKDFTLILDDSPINTLLLPQLEVAAFSVSHGGKEAQGQIDLLGLNKASIKRVVWLRDVDISEADMSDLHSAGVTAFSPNVSVVEKLNLANSHLGDFTWDVTSPSHDFPPVIQASGATFDELTVSSDSGNSDLNVAFLRRSRSSEAGYIAYEQILRNRGEISEADGVFADLHDKRRSEAWRSSKGTSVGRVSAAVFSILDVMQLVFFGYGRFALPPILWAIAFVIAGTCVFSRVRMQRIEKSERGAASYSEFWYSLELFLPVVELGSLKTWRPDGKRKGTCLYARIHQLAGWILIPVFLAAVTGAIK
jgi:hypothetical protein